VFFQEAGPVRRVRLLGFSDPAAGITGFVRGRRRTTAARHAGNDPMASGGDESIAVLGGNGMLGTDVAAMLCRRGYEVRCYDLPAFDIRRQADRYAALRGVAVAINCAAYTNVDGAEREPELAQAVNADAVGRLGLEAAELGVYVVHIGTDFVFDGGLDRPYAEDDAPRPLNAYGRSKLDGERALAETNCRAAIVRVQWTYGAGGRSFVTKLLAAAAQHRELRVVDDQIGSPTWTRDVALALAELVAARVTGLYHFAASGYATRFEVARHILRRCGLERTLVPCRSTEFPAAAVRPWNSRFDCRRIDAILTRPRPAWERSLDGFLAAHHAAATG
jgi:dTDP-4-dehydrorhamnose reductase